MTHAMGSAEAMHDPGPIVRGIFQDEGWGAVSQTPLTSGMSLDHSSIRFNATNSDGTLTEVTPPQTATVTFTGSSAAWTATSNQPWLVVANGSGSGNGLFIVSVVSASG